MPILLGMTLQKPDVGHRRGQLDVAHPFAADLGLDYLNAALFTDDAAVFHPLIFAAVTFVVLGRSEYLGAKKTVPLRFKGSVIDSLGFFDLPVRPAPDLLRGGQGNLDRINR